MVSGAWSHRPWISRNAKQLLYRYDNFELCSLSYVLKFSVFVVPIDSLADGRLYTFQVSSVSTNNYEAFSKEFEIITPQYKIYQAIIVGAVSLLILLACAGILFYLKRHLFTTYSNEDKV